MLVLTLRTDKPEAEIGLFDGSKELGYESWQAHRELGVTIHKKIYMLLKTHKKTWHDLEGIVCYKGPGSFTGLRIGITIANTLADSLGVPTVATNGKDWIKESLDLLNKGGGRSTITPDYGTDAHITQPKK